MVWNTLRFKPPPTPDQTSLGWRIEFRPMEVQNFYFIRFIFYYFIF